MDIQQIILLTVQECQYRNKLIHDVFVFLKDYFQDDHIWYNFMLSLSRIISIALLIAVVACIYDISHFGAVPNSDVVSDQFKNQKAILAAIAAAN